MAAGEVVGGEGAEGGVDQIDAGEGCLVDAGLQQQLGALAALVGGAGLAAAQLPGDRMGKGFKAGGCAGRPPGRRQGRQQWVAGLQLLIEGFPLQDPAVVVGGVAEGCCAAGGGEAADAGGIERALAGPGSAVCAPAAGGIDGDQVGADQ